VVSELQGIRNLSEGRETKPACKSIKYFDCKIDQLYHSRSFFETVVVVTLGIAVVSVVSSLVSGDNVVVFALASAIDIAEASNVQPINSFVTAIRYVDRKDENKVLIWYMYIIA